MAEGKEGITQLTFERETEVKENPDQEEINQEESAMRMI